MSLTAGAWLGPYEILALLGTGGMGEVWKARDTRLNRLVAVKRLTEPHSGRFEQEARAIAALNHPNICQIYDIGADYLVLEYVEGQTLADRIRSGGGPGLPQEEVLRITAAYMSPEQAEGQPVDVRSDVFSFGAVLYEMISGSRAFGGTSALQMMNAVVRDEPPPLQTSPSLERIVRRCLQKLPPSVFRRWEKFGSHSINR